MKTVLLKSAELCRKYRDKLIAVLVLLLYVTAVTLLGGGCILRSLTGYPCPGCGMTRALLAAVQLRFADAFGYHLMFWSVPILFLAFLRDGKLFESRRHNVIVYIALTLGFLANWLQNLAFFS